MGEFLKQLLSGTNTPWIIGILTAAITGIFSLRKIRYEKREENNKLREEKRMENEKLRYEKRLEKFKETNESLFKEKKQEVLAAIATLSIFKKDPEFEKNTIDVLLSRLYTELDYDIINSILTTLIQDSNRSELLYIAEGLQDINRNFFVKKSPMDLRIGDINAAVKKLYDSEKVFQTDPSSYNQQLIEKKVEYELFLENRDAVLKKYHEDFNELFVYQKYRLVWHKQVSADAYATFMRKAYLANKSEELVIKLFQNDFNFVYMAEVKATSTCIERSAFGTALFVKVDFDHILAYGNTFSQSQIIETTFKNGDMNKTDFPSVSFDDVRFENLTVRDSSFESSVLKNSLFSKIKMKNIIFTKTKCTNTKFENIEFENCTFNTADFVKTSFINCTGLYQDQFLNALCFDHDCVFPEGITVEHYDDYVKRNPPPKPAEPEQTIL